MKPSSIRVALRHHNRIASVVDPVLVKAKQGLFGEAIRILRRISVFRGDRKGEDLKATAEAMLDDAAYEAVDAGDAIRAVEAFRDHMDGPR